MPSLKATQLASAGLSSPLNKSLSDKLPTELLDQISNHVEDVDDLVTSRTLIALSMTCRRWTDSAQKALCRHLSLHGTSSQTLTS